MASGKLHEEMLSDIIIALVDSANDKNEDVQRAICSSLQTLGAKKPEVVLLSCSFYLAKHPKLPIKHRTLILKTMHKVCDEADSISSDLSKKLIKQATDEMIVSKDVIPEWQGAASSVLVSLGEKWCHEVMEALLIQFQPGIVPHFFIVQTLAHLASRNVYGMVPFLKSVLGTLLSVIGSMHQDNIKWVTAFALARFGDAVCDYIANIDKAPDPSVKKEVYETEFNIAYDHLINWLPGKEMKLRSMIIEAIGCVSQLISSEKYDERLNKVMSTILSAYRKSHSDLSLISQSFCMILDAGFKKKSAQLDVHVDAVINTLFPQVCDIPDYSEPSLVKNHNEVLRCFCLLARHHPDTITELIITNLESSNERSRIGSLTILRHLVNTSETHIHDKMSSILIPLKLIALDNNQKVQHTLAHLIVSLAHHGYLEQDIGPLLVEFLIRLCSNEISFDNINGISIRSTCENVLHVISTTVPNMETVLWPHLLNYLLPLKYTPSIGAICKNAAHFATKFRNDEVSSLEINYKNLSNINESPTLIARLLVLCGDETQLRHSILQLLKALAPTFHRNVVPTMDAQIPHLLSLLNSDGRGLTAQDWQENVLKFLTECLNDVDEQEWYKTLGRAFADQIQLYNESPQSKAFLFKCLGEVIKKVDDEVFARTLLEVVFSSTRHLDPVEREGCAICFGKGAIAHLFVALNCLQNASKPDSSRRHSALFSFFTDTKSEIEQETAVKCTLILCYGYVTNLCPPVALGPQLEPTLVKYLMSQFQFAKKSKCIKLSLLRAISLVAEALHPSRFRSTLNPSTRLELINNVHQFVTDTNSNDVLELSLQCLTNLIQLEPILAATDYEKCLKLCVDKIYTSNDETNTSAVKCLNALNILLHTILLRDSTTENLFFVSSILCDWFHSDNVHERKRSVASLVKVLEEFLKMYSLQQEKKVIRFSPMGAILARLIPRCSDTDHCIRQMALLGISNMFRLASCFDGLSTEYFDTTLEELDKIRLQLSSELNAELLFETITKMGQVIASHLPSHQVIPFLHVLYEGLLDPISSSSAGVCVVFNAVIRNRGGELHQQVDVLLQLLHRQLNCNMHANTRKASLQIVRNIASHHLISVIDYLLGAPTPFDGPVASSWQALAQDPSLNADVLLHLLQNLGLNASYVYEHPDPRNSKHKVQLATPRTLAVLSALKELFRQAELEKAAITHFSQLFASFVLTCGIYVNSYTPPPPGFNKPLWPPPSALQKTDKNTPVRVAIDTFSAFLLCARQDVMLNTISEESCWLNFENTNTFPDAVVCLAKSVCEFAPESLSRIVSFLSPATSSSFEPHRVVAVAFFCELIHQRCNGDGVLLELIMNSLVNSLIDSSSVVRRLSVRGLGHVGQIGADEFGTMEWFGIHKYSTTVLAAMISGLDDNDDAQGDIALEAMGGLSKMLVEIEANLVAPQLIRVVLCIRPCFENIRADVRQAAFQLFGDLSKFASGDSEAGFVEQIHNNLVSLLLHLNDEDKNVIKACKYALRSVGSLFACKAVNTMFQKHLITEGQLHYGEFMNDLSKILVNEFTNKIPLYITTNVLHFKSSWPVIQANAAMFVGYLLGNLPDQSQIDKESTCTAVMLMLKCEDKQVRIKAAEAMSLLHQY